jgi:hypothetical protein
MMRESMPGKYQQPRTSPLHGLRAELRSRWPEWCTVSFYAALVACAIPFHEPWVDEAQAWQLARSLSLPALFKTYIRYEGSPGLWYFLLWILNRAHIGYTGLHWVCGIIALAAASLLVFASPLPRILKLSLPFTSFLLFQYAVVARNYVLVPILLFTVAYCWKKNPLLVALLLGLLANTALHAAVISAGLALVYAIEYLRKGSGRRRKLLLFALIVAVFYTFAIWTAWPPHDLALSRVRGATPTPVAHALASLVWGICEPWGLSIPFWFVIAGWFAARRKFLYLLPVLFFAIFSGEVYANWWHVGLLVPLLISLLWITWPDPRVGASPGASRAETFGQFAMILMIATQLLWSGYALFYDHYHPYSGDPAAAAFLKPYVRNSATIAVTFIDDEGNHAFDGVGILPYFDKNIYANQANSFWWWSDLDTTEDRFTQILPTHPNFVLVEVRYKGGIDRIDLDQPRIVSVQKAGYRFVHAYCGTYPQRLQLGLTTCHVIFEHADGLPSPVESETLVPVNR